MPVTERSLREVLERCHVTCLPTVEGRIPLAIQNDGAPLIVVVTIDGQIVEFRTLAMLKAQSTPHRSMLLKALLESTYRYKLLKFAYDQSDGEVVAYIDLLTGDAELTQRQIERCIACFRRVVTSVRSRCERIIQTGTDPGDAQSSDDPQQLLKDLLEAARFAGSGSSQGAESKKGNSGGGSGGGFESLVDDILSEQGGKKRPH